jgi:hypothetical protein
MSFAIRGMTGSTKRRFLGVHGEPFAKNSPLKEIGVAVSRARDKWKSVALRQLAERPNILTHRA